MKKLILAIAVVGLSVFTSQKSIAQDFEGKMTMTIEYEEVPEEIEPYLSMLPKESTLYVKGTKTRIEQNTMGGSNITIMDSKTNKGYIIMNMMGQKSAFEMDGTDEAVVKKDTVKPEVKILDETKEIAGYKCKKATVKYSSEEEPMIVWFTEEIKGVYNQQYNGVGINGAIMEYTVNAQGMEMKMSITKISKETVSDDKFTVPEGYEIKSQKEMMKMMGGGASDE